MHKKPKREAIKSRAWRKSRDPKCCIGCEQPFRYRDRIRTDGIVAIHDSKECGAQYLAACEELGIDP